ncbi:MAG TPA: acyl carrier protein [Acidobacteriota bacterium]|nr:acyl carrier protein [Acidobacteriota bacterium]
MNEKDKIVQAIYAVVEETNAELPEAEHLAKSPDTVLFGEAGKLDSMGLVNFVVAAEQRIQEDFGVVVSLSDDRALSQRNSPFRTLGTLIEYVGTLLKETGK